MLRWVWHEGHPATVARPTAPKGEAGHRLGRVGEWRKVGRTRGAFEAFGRGADSHVGPLIEEVQCVPRTGCSHPARKNKGRGGQRQNKGRGAGRLHGCAFHFSFLFPLFSFYLNHTFCSGQNQKGGIEGAETTPNGDGSLKTTTVVMWRTNVSHFCDKREAVQKQCRGRSDSRQSTVYCRLD